MRRAIVEIRREGWKVAAIYGAVYGAVVTVAVNLVLTVWRAPFLPARVGLPAAIGARLPAPTVPASTVAGAAVGLVVLALSVALAVRRPLVEQFEAANPALRESLRTARDAVASGRDTRMARRLYEDVLAELRSASSVGLLDLRRIAVAVVLLSILSVATVQVTVVGLQVGGAPGGDGGAPPPQRTPERFSGLQDGSSILGQPQDVPSGVENLGAQIDTSGGGSGNASANPAAYDNSGLGGGTIESQRAAYASAEPVEDATLIRDYTLRISEGGR